LKRSCNDAIAQCFLNLCRKNSAQWIFEADIKACFDNISHEWIMENIPINKSILNKFLKSGFIDKKRFFPTKKGTPQGGIISPVIMNMVMDGLQTAIEKEFPRWKGMKVNFVRYADDFVVTCKDKETIQNRLIPLVKNFLKTRGLKISEEKSKITHINDGFNFLSQTVRKFNGKLIIKPSKESIQSFKDKIKDTLKKNRGIPAHALIRILNPIIRGWANYHKGICSRVDFNKLGGFMFRQLYRWTKYQHGNKNRKWIFRRYFLNHHFSDNIVYDNKITTYQLFRIGYIPIKYHIKIESKANLFLPEYDKYFVKRKAWKEISAKEIKQITKFDKKNFKQNSRVSPQRRCFKSA
jgi:RNA-directed DNA polymerase